MAEPSLDNHPIGRIVFHQQQIHSNIPRQPPAIWAGGSNHYADTDAIGAISEKARASYELESKGSEENPSVN
jgi:hypothetical protein